VNGDEIVYPGVLDGVDLRYALAPDGLKETFVLANAGAPTQYKFTLDPAAGVRMSAKRLRNGAWAFVVPGHPGPLFQIAPPRIERSRCSAGLVPPRRAARPEERCRSRRRRAGRNFVAS